MKKVLKSVFAAVLAFVLALGRAAAGFAVENDTIELWHGISFGYAGELSLGSTIVEVNNDEYVYYNFDAENEGYYVVTYPQSIDGNDVVKSWLIEKNGAMYSEYEGLVYDLNSSVYYFESGVNIIGLVFAAEYEAENAEIEIEYLGSEIIDLAFPNGAEYPLINQSDLIKIDSEEYLLNIKSITLVFDSGKTKECSPDYVYCVFKNVLKKGENKAVVKFEGIIFNKTLIVAEANDYVEKIELVDGAMKVLTYYNGDYEEDTDAQFRITYKDGTQTTAKIYDEIDLKTGNPEKYTLVMRYSDYGSLEDEELYGTVRLAGFDFAELEVELVKASASENIKYFFEEISDEFDYVSKIGDYAAGVFAQDSVADSLREFGVFVTYVNNNFIYAVGDILEQISMLIHSLLGRTVIM